MKKLVYNDERRAWERETKYLLPCIKNPAGMTFFWKPAEQLQKKTKKTGHFRTTLVINKVVSPEFRTAEIGEKFLTRLMTSYRMFIQSFTVRLNN